MRSARAPPPRRRPAAHRERGQPPIELVQAARDRAALLVRDGPVGGALQGGGECIARRVAGGRAGGGRGGAARPFVRLRGAHCRGALRRPGRLVDRRLGRRLGRRDAGTVPGLLTGGGFCRPLHGVRVRIPQVREPGARVDASQPSRCRAACAAAFDQPVSTQLGEEAGDTIRGAVL